MSNIPVIFFALGGTANLKEVHSEIEEIDILLEEFTKSDYLKTVSRAINTNANLDTAFNAWASRIVFFHYLGHATKEGISLDDKTATVSDIIDYFEGKVPKVIFLNGCETVSQVDAWLAAGAYAVIATEGNISDKKAKDFAGQLYMWLAKGYTLKIAYDRAQRFIKGEYSEITIERYPIMRDRSSIGGNVFKATPFKWGLYINDDKKKEGLSFVLPKNIKPPRSSANPMKNPQDIPAINSHILDLFGEIKAQHKKNSIGLKETEDTPGAEFKFIVKCFPWTVSSHLKWLWSARRHNERRIDKMFNAYNELGKTLHYISISEFWWMDIESHKALKSKQLSTPILFDIDNPKDSKKTNFWKRFIDLQQHVQEVESQNPGLKRFIPELKTLLFNLQKEEELKNSLEKFLIFHEDHEKAYEKYSSREEQNLLEKALAELLKACIFFIKYEMLAIRSINIDSRKGLSTIFSHTYGLLTGYDSIDLSIIRTNFDSIKQYYYSNSVILRKKNEHIDRTHDFLSLSPLIIDMGSFVHHTLIKGDDSSSLRIYTYAYMNKDKYFFYDSNTNGPPNREGRNGEVIHGKMTAEDLLGIDESDNSNESRSSEPSEKQAFLARVNQSLDILRSTIDYD